MGLFEWIFDNLYIVAVVGFALFSFLGKAAKSADPNKKRPASGMPTFGGGGDSDREERSRDNSSPQQSSGHTDPRYDEQYDDRYEDEQYENQYGQPYSEPAPSSPSASDYKSENSLSNMESSLEQQMKEVERQERLIQERLNRFSSANKPVVSDSSWDIPNTDESGASPLRPADIRTGVLWAEVLGPPRSKQPFGTRGKL
ncbi:hypothetical protein MKY66_21075 [Paenibacillus sp. FSL R5-0766]|uniref:hypothetical protein n=1 Tax=unclassified Paenibacillus TaxID=185978 RepID=UPI00096F23EE|nr:hypothetical protein [Paenibacillus sp. FSL R5-0765]OMF64672.1 hypothetical protein BK141_13395 [Paenibacillus sp. FSL R5-0765]